MDTQQRQRALDPTKSFIVQAPAGSGKTELLTQRFLNLLGQVTSPEEILAITFTKKAASEMRDRILLALEEAAHNITPDSAHKQTTRSLALKALKQNQAQNWNLLDNPNRLRIQTIDSFNSWLARQLPILSQFGSNPEIVTDANGLYREAIQEFLSQLEENNEWSEAIEKLLIHLDNDLKKIEQLLSRMLQKRDQWLPYIILNAHDPQLREKLEFNLQSILEDSLHSLYEQFTKHVNDELIELIRFAGQNIAIEKPDHPIAHCKDIASLPGKRLEDKKIWHGITKLLLTEKLEWRKRLDKSIGFPASIKDPQLRMKSFLEKFYEDNDLQDALISFTRAPLSSYHDDQWKILASLHQVLKIVVAQLKLVFQQQGKIDYIENAQAALAALGTYDNPTDLALILDYKIQHILVDEFQDTSNSQYRLIEKLIAGWQENDGRTLFLVGDPMQSIYRFREAEVGLFIRARKNGIGSLPLEPLTLQINFRSTPQVVAWVNEHFDSVLPKIDDISTGAISFSGSQTLKDPEAESTVKLHTLVNEPEITQAEKIINIIQECRTKQQKIAILVRSRTHLEHIIPTLNRYSLPYQAIDIDPLTQRPVIQDLMALTKALLHHADRIAWLTVLRAPWCGLTLQDLLIISQNAMQATIYQRLQDDDVINALSIDGKQRISRILPILQRQISDRRRSSLRDWVESTWQLIGGPACVTAISDINDANTYFTLLEELDEGADILRTDDLDSAIERLYASPHHQHEDCLQIMTIHNAKGLEFDVVILPHLEAKAPYDDKQLLLWMERSTLNKNNQLILAPIHAIGDESDSIYEYIKYQQAIKSEHEIGRLLYVAATRAKKQLHLLFNLNCKDQDHQKISPQSNSLLEKLWPAIKNKISLSEFKSINNSLLNATSIDRKLSRLKTNWQNPLPFTVQKTGLHQKAPGFKLNDNVPTITGILIHKIIENLSNYGHDWWPKNSTQQQSYIKNQLLQLGILKSQLTDTCIIVSTAISNMLNDPKGQWILKQHHEIQNELCLTASIDQLAFELVIDKTFVDEQDIRWIIDYKSSHPNGIPLEQFLQNEYQKYAQQMQNYYLALREMDNRPTRLALYFPLIPAWHEWEPQ